MSLVGTRPILQDELLKYELHHRARIAIKPGITGMWQVSGRSDITDFEEVVRLDTEYISIRSASWYALCAELCLMSLLILEVILRPTANGMVLPCRLRTRSSFSSQKVLRMDSWF